MEQQVQGNIDPENNGCAGIMVGVWIIVCIIALIALLR